MYCIESGYHEARSAGKLTMTGKIPINGSGHVYESALELIKKNNGKSVVDVGCAIRL